MLFRTILIMISLAVTANPSQANQFEALFMSPGKLHNLHSEWNAECTECHVKGNSSKASEKCLNCHDVIKEDQLTLQNLHGSKPYENVSCTECHSEHLGENGKITRWTEASFQHELTSFELKDSHIKATNCCNGNNC